MAIMAMDTQINRLAVFLLLTLLPATGFAGDWEITPSAHIEETYSDNLELTEKNKESGLVSQAGVDLSADYKAQNASLKLKSTSNYAWYSHDDTLNTDYYTLAADSKILLWPNGVTFTSSASIQNQARNDSENALPSIVYADLVQVENYRAGLQYQIDNSRYSLTTSGNYDLSKSQDDIGENEGFSFSITSENGAAAKNIFWDSQANYSEKENNSNDSQQHTMEVKIGLITDYKFNPFIRYYDEDNKGTTNQNNALNTNSYGLGFRWLAAPRLYIDMSYNEPTENSSNSNDEEQDAYIDVSVNWQPTSRTHIKATRSQRFFGDTYSLHFNHKNRRLTNSITYDETVESFTRDNYQVVTSSFLCQNPNATSLNDCYVQDGDIFSPENSSLITTSSLELVEDNDYWLNKTLRWSSVLALPRTSFTLNISNSDRENLNTGSKNKTKSAGLSATRKLGPNTDVNLSTTYNDRGYNENSATDQSDIYRIYKIDLNKQLNDAFSLNFAVDHINRSSNNESYNYQENRVSLRLTKDF